MRRRSRDLHADDPAQHGAAPANHHDAAAGNVHRNGSGTGNSSTGSDVAHAGAAGAVTWPVRVAAAWSWRLLLVAAAIYLLAQIFLRIELVAFSFVLALFFTAVLHPLEIALRRVPGPRSVSAGLALLVGLAVLVGVGYFVAWQISTHSSQLGDQVQKLVDETSDWLKNGPLHLNSTDLQNLTDSISTAIKNNQSTLISGAIATVRTVVEGLGALLLILLSTFFLLRDGQQIWQWVVRLFPSATHERLDVAGHVGWRTLGGYMRGQVLIALFHGTSVTIVLLVIRVPLAAALGVVIFLGSFVPLVGLTVAGALCTAVTLLEHGLTSAIIVAALIVVLVQVEAHLLQPLIMSRSVQVHPLAVALSVLTGTILAGIVGALLAVPFVAFLNATIHALRSTPAVPIGDSKFPMRQTHSVGGVATDMASPDEQPAEPGLPSHQEAERDAARAATRSDDAARTGPLKGRRRKDPSADV